MTTRMVFLHGGSHSHLATLADPALAPYRLAGLHVRTGDRESLRSADVLVVADRLRPDLLTPWADEIQSILERGATVLIFGENHVGDWLPAITEHPRPTIFWWWRTGEDHRLRTRAPDHPAWEFFAERAVIWHYHGVLDAPESAVSLVDLHTEAGERDGSILFIDEQSTPGRFLVTTMDPVYHHGSGFMPGATQMLYSALQWATRG
ncbi:hypothetical protein L5G32_06355 [Gordonia sp. HY002]|uniref:hypothetical protein n=1 Tax=Gordonia zhenghanii TaxID=2911516 RepID=UPI001EF07089|nr:hypothetical protein [Gordonia zhenghanii]MCF8569885.1 hypothetical protein [Gordonia zhenghanii]MCF8602431.1 hypothetical protein [Gordonia zhenghanii]